MKNDKKAQVYSTYIEHFLEVFVQSLSTMGIPSIELICYPRLRGPRIQDLDPLVKLVGDARTYSSSHFNAPPV